MAKAKKLADKDIASFIKKVASAGRGGDTELAFLSASARDLLKKLGGAGTKNPKTGLREYRAAAKFAKSRAEQAEPMGLFGNTPVTPTTPVVPAASPAPLSVASPFQPSSMAPDTVTRQAEPEERAPVRGSAAADMQQFNTASTGPSAAQREAERQAQIRAQQEAAQQEAARQAQARAQQEAARQAAEQQARERAQQEAARLAEERARQEALRKSATERAQQEAARKAAEERAQQEAARQAAEQQAQARAQQEAAARAAAQEQARLQAEAAMRAQERERAAALINAQGPRFTEQAQIEPESEQVRPQPGSAAADLQQLSGAQGTQPQATQPPASVPTNLNAAAAAYAAQQERAQQEAARIAAERAQQEEAARIAAVRAQEEEAIRLATAQQGTRPQLAPGDRRRQEILEKEDLYNRPIDSGIGDRPGMGKTGGRPGGFNPYDEEADRRAQEEAARRAAEEEARRAAEQEAARKAAEEEARRKAEEDARRAAEAEAARRAAEEQARRAAEEEARRRAEQDAAAARAAEEARRLAEENARRAAEEEARRKAEEARRAAEEEARRKAEEERRKKEEEDKKNKPPGGDTGKPGPGPGAGTGTTPPGLIDSKLPVSPPPAAAPPPSGGGITFPPSSPPPPPTEKEKPIRTMDFIDNNRNGIDDRDEKPDRGRPRGEFNFGAIDPNSDIGRLLSRIGRPGKPGRSMPGKGGGAPPPQTGGGLPSRPPPTTIPISPPTAGPPTAGPPATTPPGDGGYTPGPIPVTTLPTPGFIANPLPKPPGQGTGTPYFTPTPGSLTPGTIPGNLNLPSLQTSGLPQQALGQNPNLGPGMLGGAENAGYYTDRFGNVILSPGAVKPPGRAKGGPASDKELLALLKGEKKDAYAESLKNFNSARAMLENLSDMPGETTTEYSSTPISQTIRRATRQPIRQETDRGTARGMAMELESLTAAQEPKRAPDTLAELLKMSESIRSRDAMSAKDLMRDTFGTEKLTKKQLARLGDLMTRRFAEGGDVAPSIGMALQQLIEKAPLHVRTYLESVRDPRKRTAPITAGDLTKAERQKLMDVIAFAEQDRGGRPGVVDYDTHEGYRRKNAPMGSIPLPDSDFTVTESANLRNTLGQFTFERLPDGSLVVKDRYDYTGDVGERLNPLIRYANKVGVNRPIDIKLPSEKRKK